jgi:hypothetical protein
MPDDAPRLPEVVVSPDDQREFALFLAAAKRRWDAVLQPAPDTQDDAAVPPLDIEPLVIEPLPDIARLE